MITIRQFLLALSLLLLFACKGEHNAPAPDPGPDNPEIIDEDPPTTHPVVTPSGAGWTSTVIKEGITYYAFSGLDEVTNAKQRVFVADIDLSTEKYSVKLEYHSPGYKTSEIHKQYKALATMNAGYEQESIVIKVDGSLKMSMPNDYIGTTGVPNWKSEGAVYLDGDMDVRMAFEAKKQFPGLYKSSEDPNLTNINYKLRRFYILSKETNILTSAPMLIDDFDPVGVSFVSPYLTEDQIKAKAYENPDRHQGVRHPRSVIAKTENNHVLFIVIDGRRTNLSEGMTANEVTRFLVKNFNPQYALNLDGGGSSALCVKGQGDSSTNVVNYPSDDSNNTSHSGERAVNTHFYVIERNN